MNSIAATLPHTWFLSSDRRRPCRHSLWSLQRSLHKAPAQKKLVSTELKLLASETALGILQKYKNLLHSTLKLFRLLCPAGPACSPLDLPCCQPETKKLKKILTFTQISIWKNLPIWMGCCCRPSPSRSALGILELPADDHLLGWALELEQP